MLFSFGPQKWYGDDKMEHEGQWILSIISYTGTWKSYSKYATKKSTNIWLVNAYALFETVKKIQSIVLC